MSQNLTETETSCIINEPYLIHSLCAICRIRMGDGKTYKLVEIEEDKKQIRDQDSEAAKES